MIDYREFLETKLSYAASDGIDVDEGQINSKLYPFQQQLVLWALRKGRAAIFADCGLGKTPMQLEWASHMHKRTGKPVLILTPLAVASQTVHESEKFGIEVSRSLDGAIPSALIVTNYERLHHFDSSKFGAVVCDESSILKNFNGQRKAAITEFMRRIPYRLLCTATAAPNDYIELGTSSEALGYLGHIDMLNRFFTNKNNTSDTGRGNRFADQQWRFKPHAEQPFWRWVASWARALRKPSDLGYSDDGFKLPHLITREIVIEAHKPRKDMLFDVEAIGLADQRELKRRTIPERCEAVAEQINGTNSAVVWCHLNDEGDMLERIIPDAVQVAGKDSDEAKEEKLAAFQSGQIRVMVIKPKIGGFGLNWQHCNKVSYFPSHSYEQYYQAIRRCWRFGQNRPVMVHIVRTDSEQRVMENLERKAEAADKMFDDLVSHMTDAMGIQRDNNYINPVEVPTWL